MTTVLVKDCLGRRGKTGDLGLELEVEADGYVPTINTTYWQTKQDNSLRGGPDKACEYVSNGALTLADSKAAIRWLCNKLSEKEYNIKKDSPRTSYHVHCNMLYHTPVQLWTASTAYWLTENLLSELCAEHRRGNHFCYRIRDAEGTLSHCIRDLRQPIPFTKVDTNDIRYSGQNLAAIAKFGTLEYRLMEGTIEREKLDTWTTELYNLVTNAKNFSGPDNLMDVYFSCQDKSIFLNQLFSSKFTEQLMAMPDAIGKMEDNEGSLCELAYFHDWQAWENRVEKNLKDYKFPSKNELPLQRYEDLVRSTSTQRVLRDAYVTTN